MAGPSIPSVQVPVVATGGLLTREWHSFFLRLRDASGADSTLRELIDQVIGRVEELEQGGGDGATFLLQGLGSVVVNGTPAGGLVQVVLDNDSDAPGATWYYGTGADGMRGWFAVADAVAATADLTRSVDPGTGVATFGLADLANPGTGGALVKISRDGKGRVASTSQATTDDLAEGSTNRYFTDQRARDAATVQEAPKDGKTYGRKDGEWSQVTSGTSIQFPFYNAAGTFAPVPLTSDNKLPFFLTDGTQANIPMVTA